ncbi:MAG: hypothetical protein PHE78_02790, partial [Candidatus Gastranaerophilales bacterium]|nr:hypothetical protein [Candidatus Gastranaerophilales bacterium]
VQDVFEKSDKFTEATKEFKDDDLKNANILIDEAKDVKASDTTSKEFATKVFGDKETLTIEDALKNSEYHSLEEIQKTLVENADADIIAQEKELASVKTVGESLENGKGKILQEGAKEGDVVTNVVKEDNVVKIEKGKMVKEGEGLKFVPEAENSKKPLSEVESSVKGLREAFDTKVTQSKNFNITKETKLADEVKKVDFESALIQVKKEGSEKAKTAFEALKDKLPKIKSVKAAALYAAGGAALGALIAAVAAPSKKAE